MKTSDYSGRKSGIDKIPKSGIDKRLIVCYIKALAKYYAVYRRVKNDGPKLTFF